MELKMPRLGLAFTGYMLLTYTEKKENDRDYGQLKPTFGVTKSGQECFASTNTINENKLCSINLLRTVNY